MKKYNREKRASYKTHKYTRTNTQREGYKPQIHARYDGYKRTEYIVEYARTSDRHAQEYVRSVNAINEIFPDINAPHNAQTHLANAPYKQFIAQEPSVPYTRPAEEERSIYTDTRRAKCVIYNEQGKLIYFGIIRRTIEIHDDDIRITLHKGDRQMQAYTYAPAEDVYGYTVKQLHERNIEFYHI